MAFSSPCARDSPRARSFRRSTLLLLPLFGALAFGCPLLPLREVSGTVSGDTIAGVTLSLNGPLKRTTTTDASGHYAFGDLPIGDYRITPSLDGHRFVPENWMVELRGHDLTEVNFVASSYLPTISGAVRGSVWSGVAVELSGTANLQTTTDLAGHYQFKGLRDGTYRLSAKRVGQVFSPESRAVTVNGYSVDEQDFTSSSSCHGRWCWMSPFPQGNNLNAFWGSDSRDLWAVGNGGAIVHWDGISWSSVESGTTATLSSIWGAGSDDIWAIGDAGTILHWDGYTWSVEISGTSSPLSTISGNGPNDIWIHGYGVLLHWDGHTWSSVENGAGNSFYRVWSVGSNEFWALAGRDNGTFALHWNGREWREVGCESANSLQAVWGADPDDIWIAGSVGTILHWDGNSCTSMNSGTFHELRTIWGSGANDIWAAGRYTILHWDGLSWSFAYVDPTQNRTYINELWGTGPNDVWALAADTIFHWDGKKLLPVKLFAVPVGRILWGIDPSDLWMAGAHGLLARWDGYNWYAANGGTAYRLHGVWGSSSNDVWAVGDAGTILHWNGYRLSLVNSGTTQDLYAVGGNGPDDAWALGMLGGTFRWDGERWTLMSAGAPTKADSIWSSSSNDVWVAYDNLFHWNGSKWSYYFPGGDSSVKVRGVWGSSPNDVWAFGRQEDLSCEPAFDRVFRWDGAKWTTVRSVETSSCIPPEPFRPSFSRRRIWGTGPNDVWFPVYALHWNGIEWSGSAGMENISGAFWGNGPDDILAIGEDGIVRHWNGSEWSTLAGETPVSPPAQGYSSTSIWASSPDDIWIVGADGDLFRWQP